MRVALVGFGLIGGSIARALRARETGWTVAAWSPSGAGPARAAADGVIERAARDPAEAFAGAALVVLAAPPLACLELLGRLAGPLRAALPPEAVVTDVASTKRRIVARAQELGLPFVGGHPMAGLETIGYESAAVDLFVGRPWVICAGVAGTADHGEPAAAGRSARVEALARAVGAEPVHMAADRHDAAVAAISHLPLVVSAALAEAVLGRDGADEAAARRLAAGGWASMTRLARGDADMGAGILATNADEVAARLRALRDVLESWLAEIDRDAPDPVAVRARLAAARDLLGPST